MSRLGIDIGTTSIKCCLIAGPDNARQTVYHSKHVHNASLTFGDDKHEQSVKLILDAICKGLQHLLEQYHLNVLDVETVSICCQMHGVVLWNDSNDTSNLITWQDHRCSDQFIMHLRERSYCGNDLHTGYGCGTLSWLAEHSPDDIKKFKHCGSIADLFVYDLCALDEAVISDHNAQSWGYFDDKTCSWDWAALNEVNVATMPRIVRFGEQVGTVVCDRYKIRLGARVNIPIGDLQASVYAVLGNIPGRVFNYGTASQLICTTEKSSRVADNFLPPSVRRTLYTEKYDLITAASLNGGNCVDVIFKLFNSLTDDNQIIDYTKLMELAYDKRNTSLKINPLFYSERHATTQFGSFSNIRSDNFTVGDIAAAVFQGIIDNLCCMVSDFKGCTDTLYAVGIANRKIMQFFLKQKIGDFVLYKEDVTAAYGAILFDKNNEH